jgi:CHASE2 domain-containing sensor protein
MGAFVFQESSTNSEAETGLNALVNELTMKQKMNKKRIVLFVCGITIFSYFCVISFLLISLGWSFIFFRVDVDFSG